MIQCRQELHSHVFRFHRLHQRRADSDSQGIANPIFWLLSKIIYLFGGIAVHNSCFGGIGSPLALVCMHDKNAPFSLSCIEEGTAISRAFLRINGRELSPLSILYAVFELFAQAPTTRRLELALLHGRSSGCTLPFVDIKTKVPSKQKFNHTTLNLMSTKPSVQPDTPPCISAAAALNRRRREQENQMHVVVVNEKVG